MMKASTAALMALCFLGLILSLTTPTIAETSAQHTEVLPKADSAADAMGPLFERVKELEKQVERLQQFTPNFPALMPEISERFHVLHYAIVASDWAVVQHEEAELNRLVEMGSLIDAQKGALLRAYLGPQLAAIAKLVDSRDRSALLKAMKSATVACNSCHAAVGSPFIEVLLTPPKQLSLRHSHKLKPRPAMRMHAHEQ